MVFICFNLAKFYATTLKHCSATSLADASGFAGQVLTEMELARG